MFFRRYFLLPFRLGHLLDSVVPSYFIRRIARLTGNEEERRIARAADMRPAAGPVDEEKARALFPYQRLTPVQYADSVGGLCLWKPYVGIRFRDERLNRWLAAVAIMPPLASPACEQYARRLFPFAVMTPVDWIQTEDSRMWVGCFIYDQFRYRDRALDRWLREAGGRLRDTSPASEAVYAAAA